MEGFARLTVVLLAWACWTSPALGAPEMLLVDKGGDRILRYDAASGAFLGVSSDEATSGFDTPIGVAKLADWVYVSATTNQRVIRYDARDPATNEILLAFPSTEFPGLRNARGMSVGPDGRIYIAVEGPPPDGIGVILVFDPELGVMSVYADFPGTAPPSSQDGLVRPFDVAFGPDGNLYVANKGVIPSKPGANLLRFEGPLQPNPGTPLPAPGSTGALYALLDGQPQGLAFGPDFDEDAGTDIYVSHNRPSDRLAVVSGPLGMTPGTHLGPFLAAGVDEPSGLGFWDGKLFVSATPDDQVLVYDAMGNFHHVFAPVGSEPPDSLTGLLLDDPVEFIFEPAVIQVPAASDLGRAILVSIMLSFASVLLWRSRSARAVPDSGARGWLTSRANRPGRDR